MSSQPNADLSNIIHSGCLSKQDLRALPAFECSCRGSDKEICPRTMMESNTALKDQMNHEAKYTQNSTDVTVSGCPVALHDNCEERLSISVSDLARNDPNSRKELSNVQWEYVSEDPTTIQIQWRQTDSDSLLGSSKCRLQTTRVAYKPSLFILQYLRTVTSLRHDGLDRSVQRNQPALQVHPIIFATIAQLWMSLSYFHLNLEQPSWLLRDIVMVEDDVFGSWAGLFQLSPVTLNFLSFMFSSTTFIVAQLFCYHKISMHDVFSASYSICAVLGVVFWFALGATTLEVIIVLLPLTLDAGLWLLYTWQWVSNYRQSQKSGGMAEKIELLKGAGI